MKILVRYWIGTTQYEGIATTYRGARRLAARNQNAKPPSYYDASSGAPLYHDGFGLLYDADPNDLDARPTYAVIG